MSKINPMDEKNRAERLAYDIDQRLRHQQALTEQSAPEDRPLLDLVGHLSNHMPFAATAAEQMQLREKYEQARSKKTLQQGAFPLFRSLKPAAQALVWGTLLIGILVISSVLVSNLVGQPADPGSNATLTTPEIMQTQLSPTATVLPTQTSVSPTEPLPSPTLSAPKMSISDQNLAVFDLLDHWQQPLLASPGWIHTRTRFQVPAGNDLYGGLTEYLGEDWYLIDSQTRVIAAIHVHQSLGGAPLHQFVTQNGKTTNLTFGGESNFEPYPLDLAFSARESLRLGDQVRIAPITVDSNPAILLTLTGMVTRRDAVDATTGAWLYTEYVKLQEGDDPQTGGVVESRAILETAERVDTPPAGALALFGEEFTFYAPPAPVGPIAPQGFDPTGSKLTLQSVPGDSLNAPTFWYGDISADGYLLGRVAFGSVPGGFCDRSADGSKLAFNYTTTDANGSVTGNSLRWFDLRSTQTIHQPAPELVNIGELSWSTNEETLAIFGCKADQQDCGLYLLDPATDQVRVLLPGVYANLQPIWNQEGSQIAFVDTVTEGNNLYVVDIHSGQVVYQGNFDADTGQVPADSPTNAWGETFPRGMTGNRCFEE